MKKVIMIILIAITIISCDYGLDAQTTVSKIKQCTQNGMGVDVYRCKSGESNFYIVDIVCSNEKGFMIIDYPCITPFNQILEGQKEAQK
ncbi:hypothetical protein [uncultured Arcobacter sp.]|uniref:hypothetical protein n=1 Tax=uncultured Arcobacter sp. TaxID=165434 RepID=UPI002613E3FF|nr:hypothetical protein [uncultured Arcobacter sp.]